jgi:histone acetyltransferase 1
VRTCKTPRLKKPFCEMRRERLALKQVCLLANGSAETRANSSCESKSQSQVIGGNFSKLSASWRRDLFAPRDEAVSDCEVRLCATPPTALNDHRKRSPTRQFTCFSSSQLCTQTRAYNFSVGRPALQNLACDKPLAGHHLAPWPQCLRTASIADQPDSSHSNPIVVTVDANEAVTVSIVQPGSNKELATQHQFHPKFTYPIVGEAEQIFGYKGLEIEIQFAAHDLRPHVRISYDRKFETIGTTSALDLNKKLREFLPPIAFEQSFKSQILNDDGAAKWTPPGQCVKKYSRGGEDYEVWAGSLLDEPMRLLVDNIQILIVFFIEGGQFINLDDVDWTLDRWRVYLTYRKSSSPSTPNKSPYSFVGYATTYRFYNFQKPAANHVPLTFPFTESITPKELPSRLRISQFLVTPPYQSSGHGSALYQAIYDEVMADPTILDLAVEDPSEEFDKLRDMNDYENLRPQFEAAEICLNTSQFANMERGRLKKMPTAKLLPLDVLRTLRAKNKIGSRQFARLVEMYLLAQIPFSRRQANRANPTGLKVRGAKNPNEHDRGYYWWRLLLKQRIYKRNRDLLMQVSLEERYPQVEDSARGQEDEYEGLIMMYALRKEREADRHGNGSSSSSLPARKRKVIEDDEEDDDEDHMSSDGNGSKRAKQS